MKARMQAESLKKQEESIRKQEAIRKGNQFQFTRFIAFRKLL